jgi:uroporphyrinogen-III decarboxylase
MTELTKRERVMRAMQFREVDRVPVYDLIDNIALREHFGGAKITPENAWELEYAAVRGICDATRSLMVPELNPHRTTDEDGFTYFHDYETTWVESRPFDDLRGYRVWAERDISRARAWKPDGPYVEMYRKYMEKHRAGLGDDTVIIVESDCGLENPRDKAGVELFTYLAADEPELVREWITVLNEREIRRAKAIADPELAPIMLVYTDIACKSGPLHTPTWLRREFFPLVKRLVDVYHERGVACIFHSDGNLNAVLDDLVATGIDGLNPIEKLAGMSIADVRSRFPRLVIAGGIDVSQLLTLGTPEQVRAECRAAIDATAGMGFLMGSTTELLPQVKVDNLLAMLEVARTYRPGVKARR